MKKMILLFDLDGTVIDSTEAILESFHYAFSKNGYEARKEKEITSLIGHPLQEMFRSLGVEDKAENDKIVLSYKEHYRTIHREKTILIPKAKEALELASKYARLGVVTTKTAQYSKELLEHLGIMSKFETLVGFEDVTNLKPHPEPVLKALKNMNRQEEPAWLIGDTEMDLKAAKNAKINSHAVTTGYGTKCSLSKHTNSISSDLLKAIKEIITSN